MSGDGEVTTQHLLQRVLDNGGVYSQAQNFLGIISTGVDPRTGQFMLAVNLPAIIANQLAGPTVTLTFSYNAQASLQDAGYGLGWSIGLSELVYGTSSSRLRLSSGEQFAVDVQNSEPGIGGRLVFFDHKLNDLLVTRLSADSFRVERKTGEIEILVRQSPDSTSYLLCEIRSPEGRRLFIDWRLTGQGIYRLDKIRDETECTLLTTTSGGGTLQFEIGGESAAFVITLYLTNDRLNKVFLSDISEAFTFDYHQAAVGNNISFWFPTSVSGPLGASDSVYWSTQTTSHLLPEGAPFLYLPRVTSWMHTTGSPESALVRRYQWVGNTNFLGYGSQLGFDWRDGRDNLYRVEHTYRYSVVEKWLKDDMEIMSTTRTWNNYHLITESLTQQRDCEVIEETRYGIDSTVGWDQQSAYCQLPHSVIKTYKDKSGVRTEETSYTYDNSANILTVEYPDGTRETNVYYPHDSILEQGCPPDIFGSQLDMIRFLKTRTVYPAPSIFASPTLATNYKYKELISLAPEDADKPHIVVEQETAEDINSNIIMESTLQTYEENKSSPHYGRELTAVTTLNGDSTTTRFNYTLENRCLRTDMTVQGHDFDSRSSSTSTTSDCRSTITGMLISSTNTAGVVTSFEYDSLGRILKTVIAEGTAFETVQTTTYSINDKDFIRANRPMGIGATVAVEQSDATGQRRRSWLDGAGREICVELEDIDTPPAKFLEISRTTFDLLGREISQTHSEWLEGTLKLKLTTTIGYDDWGNIFTVTGPSPMTTYTLHNPVTLTTEQWQEGRTGKKSGKQRIIGNVAGSVIRQDYYDENGTLIRSIESKRDGVDRVREQHVKAGDTAATITRYNYDAYSRMTEKVNADGSRIEWTYAGHSDGDHPISIQIKPAEVEVDESH